MQVKGPSLVAPSVERRWLVADLEPWGKLAELMDDSWYLDCDLDVAMDRVFERFLAMGLCAHSAQERVDNNDSKNAELIASYGHRARLIIRCPSDETIEQRITADE